MSSRVQNRIKIIAALALLALIARWIFGWDKEPNFDGKTLSQWLATTFYYENGDFKGGRNSRFGDAMESIGTNALPFLIKRLKRADYPFTKSLEQRVGGVRNPTLNRLGIMTPWIQRRQAVERFVVLGQRATNAIPTLLNGPASGELVNALDAIGSDGFPLILKTMEDGNEAVKFTGLFCLQAPSCDRSKVVETWLRFTKDTSPRLRWAATVLLWSASKSFEQKIIPRLKELELDTDKDVAAYAS